MQILAGTHLDPNVMEKLRVTVERQQAFASEDVG